MNDQRRDHHKPSPAEPRPAGEGAAAGSATDPIAPGEAQPGELNEVASNLGGPVDVLPGRRGGNRDNPTG